MGVSMEKKEYKPKIGKKVYIIQTGDIYEERKKFRRKRQA